MSPPEYSPASGFDVVDLLLKHGLDLTEVPMVTGGNDVQDPGLDGGQVRDELTLGDLSQVGTDGADHPQVGEVQGAVRMTSRRPSLDHHGAISVTERDVHDGGRSPTITRGLQQRD